VLGDTGRLPVVYQVIDRFWSPNEKGYKSVIIKNFNNPGKFKEKYQNAGIFDFAALRSGGMADGRFFMKWRSENEPEGRFS